MATASISGKDGSVAGAGATEIKEWNISITTESLEATSQASAGIREFVLGLTGATGSLSAIGITVPTRGIATLTLKAGGSGTPQFDGIVNMENVDSASIADGMVEFSADFTFTGAVTVSTVA